MSAVSIRLRASSMVRIFNDDGNTRTKFSSRFSSTASSSHETAIFTRVSSVSLSRPKSPSTSSLTISPGVATTSPSRFDRRPSRRRDFRIAAISCLSRRDRAESENCFSISSLL